MDQNLTPGGASPAARPPLGRNSARLDDKGRLKLPAEVHRFFDSFPEKRLFVTSLDGMIAQLYPLSVWLANEELLQEYTDDPEALSDYMFNAHDMGSEADMDGQGRVTINSELRNELKLVGTELHLIPYKGHIQVIPDAMYQERRQAARSRAAQAITKMEKAGAK